MAVTQNTYTGDGSTVLYNFTFPYLTQTDVKVKLDGATQATTAYFFANATTVQMNSAPANGVKVIIYRDTDNDNKKATFYPGSAIKAEDLNNNIDQILYVAQEVDNNAMSSLGDTPMQGDMEFGQGMGIVFEGATTDNFETRLAVADPTADRTITLPNVTGTVITTGDTGTVTSAMITDATIVNADINGSAAIAQSKLNIANATTSAAGYQSAADKTKLDGIETAATADQTNAEIRAAVEAATDSNVFTDADHTKLNNIETAATADQTAAEIRTLVGDASNSNVFTDSDNTKLAGIETAATADQTASEIKALIASSPLDASHLAADSVTTSELADAELTTLAGMQSGTASILADSTALTSTTTELNQLDGKTLGETTLTTNSNTAIPTSKAVNDRIVTVTNALGGFVAIADKDNFPTSHPDPGENAGTVVSISNAVGISVNSSGVGSLATRAGGSDAVVINGFPSALRGGATVGGATNANPYVLPANVGLQVQTTSTAHTYDYHKYLINEEDANKLSGDIQDFQERYRVASSAPTSNNDDGDLYFDTSTKKMKVYNGATSQWDDVASSSSSYIVTLSESFDGSRTDFTMSTAATDAQSTIVSINGVVQKPNAGTSTPSEGFAISGNTLKLSNAPATGSTYFVVVLGDTVSIGTPSDNTVSTAKIQNLAVTGDKVATNLDLVDNKKIRVGTGNDLEIYHDGNSYVTNTTANQLAVQSNDLKLRSYTDLENYLVATHNGSVDLYYNGTKTLNTITNGIQVRGTEGAAGNIYLYADEGDDYGDLWLHKANTDGKYHIQNKASGSWEDSIVASGNGAVELYYDGSKKFETNGSGVQVFGHIYLDDSNQLKIGSGDDLQIYHNGTHSEIADAGTGDLRLLTSKFKVLNNPASADENMIVATENGSVDLYHNGFKSFNTTDTGIHVWGPEGTDAQIYMYADDGDDSADKWRIASTHVGNSFTIETYASGSWLKVLSGHSNGACQLHFAGNKKFETDTDGVQVTGILQAHENISDSGYTSHGWHVLQADNSGSSALVVENSGDSQPYGIYLIFSDTDPDDNTRTFINMVGGTTERCKIYSDGDIWNHDDSFTGSDQTLKENIVDATPKLEDLKKLKVRNFNWKSEYFPEKSKKKQLGFIAQEVEQVFPALVSEHDIVGSPDQDGHTPVMKKAIKQAWAPILVKALQEAVEKIETLETKVAALEAK